MSNNDVVIIELDRPRELRFRHKALKMAEHLTGKSLSALDVDNMGMKDIEVFMYCGLLADAQKNNEKLTLEQMEDLLDEAPSVVYYIQKFNEAISKAFGATDPNLNEPEK